MAGAGGEATLRLRVVLIEWLTRFFSRPKLQLLCLG